ncbi:MAG: glycosyltransferase [Flavobacteriales bacterium]|nr:glycosyltransferase [Flavobacteriales bacterium]MCB9166044.1 glycosyltransferase [Flavobacteriales bacterium]
MNRHEGGKRTRGVAPGRGGPGPLVSIVTVVFNGAATIERTIRSVLEQEWTDIEYIVVDGGSTDGTLDILARYEDRIDLWVSGKDEGIYDAMNKGVALCTGEWIGLINADDWYAADAVSRVVAAVASVPTANIVHGDIDIHYPNGASKRKHARLSNFLLRYWEMVLNHPTFFVRRSYYTTHPFDITMRVGGDHKWTLQAHLEDPTQFHYIPEVIAHFSAGGASMTIPLKRSLNEGRKMSDDLGLGPWHRFLGSLVRTVLFVPQYLKLMYNRAMARH